MAAWGYEFYLLVLKLSQGVKNSGTRSHSFAGQHLKIKFVSRRGQVISSMI